MKEDFFNIVMEDGEISTSLIDISCNTRKSRDKRVKRHTVGIFLGAYTCGTVTIFDELYGSESLSQVYGILIDSLENITDKYQLNYIIYDDSCHLAF